MKPLSKPSQLLSIILLSLSLLFGCVFGVLSRSFVPNQDSRFKRYTNEIFRQEMQGNSLTLHYTLAHPESYYINTPAPTLGSVSTDAAAANDSLKNYERKLQSFSYEKLSPQNQITYDMLWLYLHTLQEGTRYQWLEEYISPSLGIQAQLPILFAEYYFHDTQDIKQYLSLLGQTKNYFQRLLDFEREKSHKGYFMTDAALDEVLDQCNSFIQKPKENYLLDTFKDRLKNVSGLSQKEAKTYILENQNAILNTVIPAYENLMKGLSALRGSGKNDKGLCFYPNGQEYYCYLLKSQVGVYLPPQKIRQRLSTQLMNDYQEFGLLLQRNPSLLSKVLKDDYNIGSPRETLDELQQMSQKDFPALSSPSYELKQVDASLSPYLSPAFYLTPPVDTLAPNSIYLNPASHLTGLSLYTTLAHEGFPGHLYQTQYFGQTRPSLIRYLPGFGGYVEGWATYTESYAYSYAKADSILTRLLWLNRSINLCLCSLLDMGIHYYGWSLESAIHYLSNFQITNTASIKKLYQSILENPCNYLRYCLGYLNFYDLREEMALIQGNRFQATKFHRQILQIGPVQFPVLRKHMGLSAF